MKCIVVGAGAAGMMAAMTLGAYSHEVLLIEKNEKLGKKLYITGKGRCNITNLADREDLLNNIVNNPKFAFSALSKYGPYDVMDFFNSRGCELKVERGNRVFPVSDKSSDIIKCFAKELSLNNVKIMLNTKVEDIIVSNGTVIGVKTKTEKIYADKTIIATGGVSYPLTGSTGDGYNWAKKVGHNVNELKPALSAIECPNTKQLSGVSLKNVQLNASVNDKLFKSFFGEMLFTGTGLSGPIVLSLSSYLNAYYSKGKFNSKVQLFIDLKPKISCDELEDRLLNDLKKYSNQDIKNILQNYTVKALIPLILSQANVQSEKKCNSITKEERTKIIETLKGIKFVPTNFAPIEHAIVTSGGIDCKEINPKSMESKIIKNLYFIGEILDIDALTGGFNLQIAMSLGYAAAKSIIGIWNYK